MCLKVEFSGRTAVMLCDPGYHVARVVTVMADGAYPHTGKILSNFFQIAAKFSCTIF